MDRQGDQACEEGEGFREEANQDTNSESYVYVSLRHIGGRVLQDSEPATLPLESWRTVSGEISRERCRRLGGPVANVGASQRMTGRVATKAPTQAAGPTPTVMARRATRELNVRYIVVLVSFVPGLKGIELIVRLKVSYDNLEVGAGAVVRPAVGFITSVISS